MLEKYSTEKVFIKAHPLNMVHMATSPFSIVTVCYQLEFLSVSLMMQLCKSLTTKLTSFFRRKRNRDRVYVYDPDLEHYRTSWFLRFYSALGCINIPQPEKYQPGEFSDIFSSSDNKDGSTSPSFQTLQPAVGSGSDIDEIEEDLEIITLGEDLPPVESEGDQEYPLAMLIAWEYPEEEMPKFFYLGYY